MVVIYIKTKKKNKKLLLIIVSSSLLIAILVLAFFLIATPKDTPKEKEKVEDAWYDVPFDPNVMPTYHQVVEIMDRAITDTFGEEYWDEPFSDKMEFIEGTQISFDPTDFTDSRDRMAMMALAFQSNPYAITEDMPHALQKIAGISDGSVREMPDGTSIDLANLVEEYTDMKYFNNREIPTRVKIEGYRNNEWFEDVVDLSAMYQEYYEEPEGY